MGVSLGVGGVPGRVEGLALTDVALQLDLAKVDGGAGAGSLRGVHLLEHCAGVAHLLLAVEVADEEGGPSASSTRAVTSAIRSGVTPVNLTTRACTSTSSVWWVDTNPGT